MRDRRDNENGRQPERSGDGWSLDRRLTTAAALFPIEVRNVIAERLEHLAGLCRAPTAAEIAAALEGIPRQDLAVLARIHAVYSRGRLAQIAEWGEGRPEILEEREREGYLRILECIEASREREDGQPDEMEAVRLGFRELVKHKMEDAGRATDRNAPVERPRNPTPARRRLLASRIAAGLMLLLAVAFAGVKWWDENRIRRLEQKLDNVENVARLLRRMGSNAQDERFRLRSREEAAAEIEDFAREAAEQVKEIKREYPDDDR